MEGFFAIWLSFIVCGIFFKFIPSGSARKALIIGLVCQVFLYAFIIAYIEYDTYIGGHSEAFWISIILIPINFVAIVYYLIVALLYLFLGQKKQA